MKKKSFLLFILSSLLFSCGESNSISMISSNVTSESSSIIEYQTKEYSNPIKFKKMDGSDYFVAAADPEVIYGDDGYFYLYITNANCEMGNKGISFDLGPIFRSKDLTSWTWYASVFENNQDAISWGTKDAGVWGPHVIKVGDHYNYYYALSTWGDSNPGVGVATSPTPYGPWTHYGKLLDQEMTGVRNGIDPFVAYYEDELYILWGSFFGIAATKLTDDGTELFYGDQVKDYISWPIANNRSPDQGMNVDKNYEGTFVIEKDGMYYFMGSQGTCLNGTDSTYNVKCGVSDSLLGPYVDAENVELTTEEHYGELVVGPSDKVAGTGHNSVIQDFNGDYWLIYHGFDINSEINSGERQLFMDKILWDEKTGFPYIENKTASVNKTMTGPLTIK